VIFFGDFVPQNFIDQRARSIAVSTTNSCITRDVL